MSAAVERWNDRNGVHLWNKVVFDAIRQLMKPPEPKKRKIGFLVEEKAAA